MTDFLNTIEIYTTKDGFNSYWLLQKDNKNVVLIDPVSFDTHYYQSINERGLQVSDVILTAKWHKKTWQQGLISIYNPHIVSVQEELPFANTAHGRIDLLPLPAFGGQVVVYGNCLFMGAMNILSQCAGGTAKALWKQFLEQFSKENYIFSCYGPPDTLASLKKLVS